MSQNTKYYIESFKRNKVKLSEYQRFVNIQKKI